MPEPKKVSISVSWEEDNSAAKFAMRETVKTMKSVEEVKMAIRTLEESLTGQKSLL